MPHPPDAPTTHQIHQPSNVAANNKYESHAYKQKKATDAFYEQHRALQLNRLRELANKFTDKLKDVVRSLSSKDTPLEDKPALSDLVIKIKAKLKQVNETIQQVTDPKKTETERQLEQQLETLKKEAEARGVSLAVLRHSLAVSRDPYKLDLRTTSLKLSELNPEVQKSAEKFQDWLVETAQLCGRSIEFITPVMDADTSELTGSYIVKYIDRTTAECVYRSIQASRICAAEWYNGKTVPPFDENSRKRKRGEEEEEEACSHAIENPAVESAEIDYADE